MPNVAGLVALKVKSLLENYEWACFRAKGRMARGGVTKVKRLQGYNLDPDGDCVGQAGL